MKRVGVGKMQIIEIINCSVMFEIQYEASNHRNKKMNHYRVFPEGDSFLNFAVQSISLVQYPVL